MIWVGLVLVVVAIVLFVLSRKAGDRALFMQATETKPIGEIRALVAEIAADLGPGGTGYAEFAEFKGTVVCDNPITGEFSGAPAAVVRTRVERQIETLRETRDSQGNVRTEWHRSSETLSSNNQEAEFHIDDGSGRLRVNPKGARLDLVKLVDRFEPPGAVEGMRGGQFAVSMGGYSLSVGGIHGADRRTIGYRFVEEALPVDRRVYALGEVADTEEGLVLRKPSDDDKKRPYVLSTKSEEELVKAAKSSAVWMKLGAAVLGLGGIALAVFGLIR
jgi:hypothetical protein